jgi:VanZ family protein
MFTTIDAASRSRGTVRLMRALSLLFLLAVVLATLYPFSGGRLRTPGLFAFLHDGLPRWWTWFDVLSNVLAYGLLGLLLTLAWLARIRPLPATVLATLACSLLSVVLEALQGYLPNRVPSLLDWLANTAGGLAGAWLGATLNGASHHSDRIAVPVRARWYEQGPAGGWVLLLLWLSAQLVPQRMMFATGQVLPLLQRALDALAPDERIDLSAAIDRRWGDTSGASFGMAIEAASVLAATCAIGALAFTLVQGTRRRLALLASVALTAFALRSITTQMVYVSASPLAWLTPGVQGGLVVGAALLYGLETLRPRGRAAAAIVATAAGTLLVNLAPEDPYFESTLAGLRSWQLENLHGLLRTVSVLWPALAIGWFWRHAGRAGQRSL